MKFQDISKESKTTLLEIINSDDSDSHKIEDIETVKDV
jgi:hypothetical protein